MAGESEAKTNDWLGNLDEDTKGWVANKGFKAPSDLLNSYRNLEKLHGAGPDKLLRLPDSMDSEDAKPVWERLGLPKEAKDYGLDPKEHGEHLASDLHEARITKDQAARFVAKQAERAKSLKAANEEAEKITQTQIDLSLQKEWGMAYDQNRRIADQAATTLGISKEQIQAMGKSLGADKAMKMLLDLGMKTGEHTFVGGQSPNTSVMAPDSASQRIRELSADSNWVSKYLAGDSEARKTMSNLQQMANPGDMRL